MKVKAIYESHVLRPVRDLDLEEGEEVEIVANGLYILHVTDFLEYHLFYPFFISARSLIISTYCRTRDLLISSSEAMFSAGIPSP